MWKQYFGNQAKIFAIDIDPRCKDLEEENIQIFIGSQADRHFLQKVKSQIPKVDILIDDGGHTMIQQIVTFEELFDHVKDNGIYLIEDLHTSYWLKFGGGYKRRGTFIEYSKDFIDSINAYHSVQSGFEVNELTKSIDSLHFYDSILVIEKKIRERPYSLKTGKPSFPVVPGKPLKFKKRLRNFSVRRINLVLRFLRLPGFIWR